MASRANAQTSPGAIPAAAPAVLSTRDPSAAFRQPGRVSVASITRPAKAAPVAAVNAAAGAAAPSTAEAGSGIRVKGLTGTLNKGDVHQTMEARQEEFDLCIRESRRNVRYVSGAIKFGFRVDAAGRISELRPISSTIGHRELELCLTEAVLATQFPKPSGRASAEFDWGMSIEPITERFDENKKNAKPFARLARKEAKELFGACEIKRRRARFRVTAYVAPGGRLLSAGAVPMPASADDKVDCVLEQFGKWHLPKVKRASKISFDVR